MIDNLINTFEELKKYIFTINRNGNQNIEFRFKNENFYHLVGLHKIKSFNSYFPTYLKSQDKKYKYIKNNKEKFNNILENQLKEKDTLKLRMITFKNLIDLLKCNNTLLYNLKQKMPGSLYNGDFGLSKNYENICCLLGLKKYNMSNNIINCIPNSWMASRRINKLTEYKRPIRMENITANLESNYKEKIKS